MSKHFKTTRPKLIKLAELQRKRDLGEEWANMTGLEVAWKSHPPHAMTHVELCALARKLNKDKNLSKKLYYVTTTGYVGSYIVNINLSHRLLMFNVVYFENYWLAVGFSERVKSAASIAAKTPR